MSHYEDEHDDDDDGDQEEEEEEEENFNSISLKGFRENIIQLHTKLERD